MLAGHMMLKVETKKLVLAGLASGVKPFTLASAQAAVRVASNNIPLIVELLIFPIAYMRISTQTAIRGTCL